MKKIILIFFLLVFGHQVFSQDSLRLILCSFSASDCFGNPSLEKTLQHFDSLGNILQVNHFSWQRCDEESVDSDYIHLYDEFYSYDSLQRVINYQSSNYNGDTIIQSQFNTSYSFDSLGNEVSSRTILNLPLPVHELAFDSTLYNSDNLYVFKLSLRWNDVLQEMDTSYKEEVYYDSLGRMGEDHKFFYTNFIFFGEQSKYYFYDTLSNVLAEYSANSFTGLDSSRYLYTYDSLSLRIESRFQKWDTINFYWVNDNRTTFSYDSISRKVESWYQTWDTLNSAWFYMTRSTYFYDAQSQLLIEYTFACPDTLCTDSLFKIVHSYYPNHSTGTDTYVFQGNNWEFSGNTYESYDNLGYLLDQGWWEVNFEGCDESSHLSYQYNANHQLIHSHSIHYTCDYRESDCDYYNLNQDSMIVMINSDTYPCPFDTIHLQVAIAGGTPPYIYHWSPLVNLLDTNVESPRIVTDSTIIYTLLVIDSLGLTASSTDTLVVKPKHLQPVTIHTTGIPCEGNSYFLIFDPDDLVQPWISQWQFNNQTINNIYADSCAAQFSGTYSVIIYDPSTSCTVSSNEVEVNLFPNPVAQVTPANAEECDGDSVQLTSNIFPQILWSTGDTTNVIYIYSPGDYFTIVSDTNGCIDTSNIVHVNFHSNPVISLGNDTVLCVDQNIILDPGPGFNSYLWQDGTTGQTLTAFSVIVDSLLYYVEVSDSNNCSGYDTLQVVFDLCSGVNELTNSEGISLYPNPSSSGNFYIRFENTVVTNSFFHLYDLYGKEVFSVPVTSSNQLVQVSFLANGVYQFRITNSGEELKSGKFVIE
jgi:hypothetical protein